jgi:hypothetical protein
VREAGSSPEEVAAEKEKLSIGGEREGSAEELNSTTVGDPVEDSPLLS